MIARVLLARGNSCDENCLHGKGPDLWLVVQRRMMVYCRDVRLLCAGTVFGRLCLRKPSEDDGFLVVEARQRFAKGTPYRMYFRRERTGLPALDHQRVHIAFAAHGAGIAQPVRHLIDHAIEHAPGRGAGFGQFVHDKQHGRLDRACPGAEMLRREIGVTGIEGSKELIDYSMTKGGIHAFTRALSASLVGKGIRVNAVAPGPSGRLSIPRRRRPMMSRSSAAKRR